MVWSTHDLNFQESFAIGSATFNKILPVATPIDTHSVTTLSRSFIREYKNTVERQVDTHCVFCISHDPASNTDRSPLPAGKS